MIPLARDAPAADVVQRVKTAFALDLEAPVVLGEGRATVVRALSLNGAAKGRPVIVKRFGEAYREHFVRERAGLSLLSTIPGLEGFVPRLLADGEAELMLLIEGVVEQGSYSEVIVSGGEVASQILVETARRLGALHGHARSRVSDFLARVPEQPSAGSLLRKGAEATLAFIQRALSCDGDAVAEGVVSSEVHSQLIDVADRVDESGVFSTITVGDMAPGNLLLGPEGPVFIDLEYCGIRNAFYDAMYWHCIYPFSGEMADRMDVAYRDGLQAAGVPVAEDQFVATMLLFMSHRLFWTLSWNMDPLFQHDRDVVPGVGMRSTICRYLREYVRFASVARRFEHTGLISVATRLEAVLSQRWPEAVAGH